MSAMEHAFKKWLEQSSDADRAKAPEVARAMEESLNPPHMQHSQDRKPPRVTCDQSAPAAAASDAPEVLPQPQRRRKVRKDRLVLRTRKSVEPEPATRPAAKPVRNAHRGSRRDQRAPEQKQIGRVLLRFEERFEPSGQKADRRSASPEMVRDGSLYYEPKALFGPALGPVELLAPVPRGECLIYVASAFTPARSSSGQLRVPTASAGIIRRVSQTARIQVGIDFGTSCTKVMYQRLGVAQRVIRPIDFKHGLDDCPSFALPSLAAFDRNGELLLGDVAARRLGGMWGHGLTKFKMLAAGRQEAKFRDESLDARFREYTRLALGNDRLCTPELLAATYLAFVMRRVRRKLEDEYQSTDLDVRFTTCVPVDQRQNDAVYAVFQRIAAVAQALEERGRDDDRCREWLQRAAELWPNAQYDEQGAKTRLFLMPEAVAATAGYLTSLAREPGLHALVDIGAGTTDVSIFHVSLAKRRGLDTAWYAARSIPMGVGRVEELVATVLRDATGRSDISKSSILQALSGVGESGRLCKQVVRDELWRMWNGTASAWSDAYRKDPQQSSWQRPAVRVFLAGGGAMLPQASRVFSESWQPGWGPYPTRAVPEPDTGAERSGLPFARLCVAFGLSTPLAELGAYSMPAEVPPKGRIVFPRRNDEQDGDQLLPRYGWT